MSHTFLSVDWLEALVEEGASLPEVDGVDLVVQHEITGAPDGKVRFFIEWRDGVPRRAELGKHTDPDVSLAAKAPDALRLVNGDIDVDVAYMQGRLKVDGDYRKFLVDYRDWRVSAAHRDLWARMGALTAS